MLKNISVENRIRVHSEQQEDGAHSAVLSGLKGSIPLQPDGRTAQVFLASLPSSVRIYSQEATEIRDTAICDSVSCSTFQLSMTYRLFA